jgi:hypothetical protein
MDTTKADKTDQSPQEIDAGQVPQRFYVKFRSGVYFEDEKSAALVDEFRSDLATEMAFAIKKVLEGKRLEDGSKKYEDFHCVNEMKVSHEMVDWIEF